MLSHEIWICEKSKLLKYGTLKSRNLQFITDIKICSYFIIVRFSSSIFYVKLFLTANVVFPRIESLFGKYNFSVQYNCLLKNVHKYLFLLINKWDTLYSLISHEINTKHFTTINSIIKIAIKTSFQLARVNQTPKSWRIAKTARYVYDRQCYLYGMAFES